MPTVPPAPVADSWCAWPLYVVCDVSSTMHDGMFAKCWGSSASPWILMHRAVFEVVHEINMNEDIRQLVHLAIVQFADKAETILKLTRLDQTDLTIREFSKGKLTDFAAVWKHLARMLPEDQKELASAGFKSERPTILFITDTGKREQTVNEQHMCAMRRAIGDERLYPHIIVIGLGGMSNEDVRSKLRIFIRKLIDS